jgi:YVTN family beta-propeller protein
MRLSDLAIVAEADLSQYFPIESENIALDESEAKLFVYSPTWQKLIVLDTQTMGVTHTIENIGLIGMFRSQYGPFLITWNGGNTVIFINTETYEVTEFTDPGMFFTHIRESQNDEKKWFVVSRPTSTGYSVGTYDYDTKVWSLEIQLPSNEKGEGIMDFKVLPNEQKAYVAIFGGWYPEYHAYGWLDSVDLVSGEVKVVPIDGGAMGLEASPDSQRLYVGTGWPVPNVNNLLVLDTQSDGIVGQIPLGKNKYNWPFTQMNHLQIDPSNDHILYGTVTDANSLIKVNLDDLTLNDVRVFNQETFQPRFFVRQPAQSIGYILIHQSANAFVFDLDKANVVGVIKFPMIRADAYTYDVAINDSGRMFIAQGETILEVDTNDMRLLKTHPLPNEISGLWSFVLSNDQRSLFAIWPGPPSGGWPPDTFLRINTSSFQLEANVKLEGGGFNSRPFELLDGSKLYALGGMQNGPVVIQIIDLESNTVKRTITFDEPGFQGISAGPNYPFAYDSNSHTLFVGATQVVLAIDTDTDVIKKVIHLGDVARAMGLESQQVTYLNAIGMVYNPQENYLYIAHVDRSFISIYDLKNDRFLPQAIPLKGYFPSFVFANDDNSKIYTLNCRSDSVSVIDVTSKTVVNVIDLHAYLP